jgi:hypothetical protein
MQWDGQTFFSSNNIFSIFKISKKRIKSYKNICTCKNVETLHDFSFTVRVLA